MPKVSVIIPTHNRARYLEEALGSVLKQTYEDYEVIVVDAGSTDETPRVLRRYGDSLRIVETPDDGRSAARNAGMALATGDYIALLDDDEVWYPEKLARQSRFLDERPDVGLSHTFTDVIDASGMEIPPASRLHLAAHRAAARLGYSVHHLCRQPMIFTSSVMFRRSLLLELGGFDATTEAFEDWDFWLRLALRSPIAALPEVLVRYRLHPQQSGTHRMVHGRIRVAEKHLALMREGAYRAPRRTRACLEAHLASANYVRAHRRAFARHAAAAIALDPSFVFRSRLGVHLAAASLPRSWWLALRNRRRSRGRPRPPS